MIRMLTITLLIFMINGETWSYFDDNSQVVELVNSGDYKLIKEDSASCPPENRPWDERDLLQGETEEACVKTYELPVNVKEEVQMMKANELENESDYDQRITEVLNFKWNHFEESGLSLDSLKTITGALSIPKSHLDNLTIGSFIGSKESFSRFDYLFLGMEFKVRSATQEYLVDFFKGKPVQALEFGSGVELYPGGGFYVTHFIFISEGRAVYVKLSWWNS